MELELDARVVLTYLPGQCADHRVGRRAGERHAHQPHFTLPRSLDDQLGAAMGVQHVLSRAAQGLSLRGQANTARGPLEQAGPELLL
ncbi:hypothetical protein ACFQ0G_29460 [Streptomyces chiangmaiensis]